MHLARVYSDGLSVYQLIYDFAVHVWYAVFLFKIGNDGPNSVKG